MRELKGTLRCVLQHEVTYYFLFIRELNAALCNAEAQRAALEGTVETLMTQVARGIAVQKEWIKEHETMKRYIITWVAT
jgi:hypothetical protein